MIYKKTHIGKACLTFILLLSYLLTSACSNESAQPTKTNADQSSIDTSAHEIQQKTNAELSEELSKQAPENKLFIHARKIISDYKLTSIKLDCLTYELQQNSLDGKHIIDVRELHSENCGGDINTSPRIFSIELNNATGEAWSDAKSILGQLEKLD